MTSPITEIFTLLSIKTINVASISAMCSKIKEDVITVEPHIATELAKILEITEEKSKKNAVYEILSVFIEEMTPFCIKKIIPTLIASLAIKTKPAQKEIALKLITKLGKKRPEFIGRELTKLIPIISDLINDARKEVSQAARETMSTITYCTGNDDLEPFIPYVLKAIIDPNNGEYCVEKLASCVFVQRMGSAAISVTIPVLLCGLRGRNEELKRTCCVIVDNICKLVEDYKEVLPLMSILKPLIKTASEAIANPEARRIAEKTYETLTNIISQANNNGNSMQQNHITLEDSVKVLTEMLGDITISDVVVEYVAEAARVALSTPALQNDIRITSFLKIKDFSTILYLEKLKEMTEVIEEEVDEDNDGVELYNGTFSLAYGTLTLLREAKMNLKWNKFYGLLGPNNSGKTTMMRAIANEQLEGFPTRAQLLSIFVEHEIEERQVGILHDVECGHITSDQAVPPMPIMNIDLSGIDWILDTINNVYNLNNKIESSTVREMMVEVGFGKNRAADPDMIVTSYSGGWKMKMQLVAARLMNADVLMLDEPTGHLDVDNIAWLVGWLKEFPGTIICTSHDSKFLDIMCDIIIDIQDRKLKSFKGEKGKCLSEFVEKYPEKKGYFELKNDIQKFVFPDPGPLEGIKSRTKIILKLQDVTYQYPTRTTPTIININLTVSQVSRVAVIGANGAGKSTAIKILVGELITQKGLVWKVPGLRLAYVAQHAFHHVEEHLDKTPVQYIMWRFSGNEDRESLEFKADELSASDEELRNIKWIIDPTKITVRKWENNKDDKFIVVPDAIMNRRNNKKEKTLEYEIKWQFKDITDTLWLSRNIITKMGYLKLVQREDEKRAAMAGLQTKHLTSIGVAHHLADFGLDDETTTHTTIRHLSGGQKVKVVIGACMWLNPHMLILDEPTNYLDRDGLGALTIAIREYKGGVLIISHNREFCEGCCDEKWIMREGKLKIEGSNINLITKEIDTNNVTKEDLYDAAGNLIDVQSQITLSDKAKKRQIKILEKKLKDNIKSKILTDEEVWEIDDEIKILKE
tara:strand:+ start:4 stop:3117 length:3114 start_codon:yes stop_codon:yes gene_type:complete